jgi:exodeoxyribonuclease-3
MDPAVKIATWNVNSIRARLDGVLDWMEANDPDVLCMQETKIVDQEFPEDELGDLDYDVVFFGQQTYNGVAIASHAEIEDVVRGLPGDGPEAERRLLAATIAGIRIVTVYVPNGREVGSETYVEKLEWLDRLQSFIADQASPSDPVVVLGDFNIAPHDGDLWDPARMAGGLFATEEERRRFRRLLDWGFVDAVHHFDPSDEQFTWWDYRGGGWQRNRGMRIDHILITKPLLDRAERITIHEKVRGEADPSDHVPVLLELR